MRDTVALHRYQQRHTEAGLPTHSFSETHWHQVLVLPAYRETPELLRSLARLPASDGRTLVILVLNRPGSDSDPLANADLRNALAQSQWPLAMRGAVQVYCPDAQTDLYLYDMELLCGPTPDALGVGLARKTGCDLALQWMAAGGISGQWLCSIDADATLPSDYFAQLESAPANSVAAVFPFRHVPGADETCNKATALYELRLHHYVLGLQYADSPYAFHTLGSCLAVRYGAYAHVHGFPRRAGAEDFYLLNKLAKLGPVARLRGRCIELQARLSSRVPFGTGPAVAAIMATEHPDDAALFYHPQCFAALAALLEILPSLAGAPEHAIAARLLGAGLNPALAQQAEVAVTKLGIAAALDHCRRQSKSRAQFLRHFHQWFDGFRTLKFIHALRDAALPSRSLRALETEAPQLWPPLLPELAPGLLPEHLPEQQPSANAFPHQVARLQQAIRQHWGWR